MPLLGDEYVNKIFRDHEELYVYHSDGKIVIFLNFLIITQILKPFFMAYSLFYIMMVAKKSNKTRIEIEVNGARSVICATIG